MLYSCFRCLGIGYILLLVSPTVNAVLAEREGDVDMTKQGRQTGDAV